MASRPSGPFPRLDNWDNSSRVHYDIVRRCLTCSESPVRVRVGDRSQSTTLQPDTACACSEDRPQLTQQTESPGLLKHPPEWPQASFSCSACLIFGFTVTKRKSHLIRTRCWVSCMNQCGITRTHQMNHKNRQCFSLCKTVTKIVPCHLGKKKKKNCTRLRRGLRACCLNHVFVSGK